MIQKKSQGSIEFMVIVGAVIFFFTMLFLGIQESTSDRINEEKRIILQNIAIQIQDEINLATKSTDGYYREFEIQEKIRELSYTANITDSLIYLKTNDDSHAIALSVQNITGNINITDNIIKKQEGVVYLNS